MRLELTAFSKATLSWNVIQAMPCPEPQLPRGLILFMMATDEMSDAGRSTRSTTAAGISKAKARARSRKGNVNILNVSFAESYTRP